jgi:hypothetical protein
VALAQKVFSANSSLSESAKALASSIDSYEKSRQALQSVSEQYSQAPVAEQNTVAPLLKKAMIDERDAAQALLKTDASTAASLDAETMAPTASTEDTHLAVIREMLGQGLGIGDATAMAEATLRHNDAIGAKLARARQLLPAGRLSTANRVDIPTLSRPVVLQLGPGGAPLQLKDELDRWQLLLRDGRFADFAALWKNHQLSDLEALTYLNAQIEALNEMAAIKKAKTSGPEGKTQELFLAAQDFGIQKGFSGPINPMFESIREDLSKNLSGGASEARKTSCLQEVTDFWLTLDQEEAGWASRSPAEFQQERDHAQPERLSRYQGILGDCQKRP